MAVVTLMPPPMAARMDRDSRLINRLESKDPVERFKGQQELSSRQAKAMGAIMEEQARRSTRAAQEEERLYQEAERRNRKYAPLPQGAKIINKEK